MMSRIKLSGLIVVFTILMLSVANTAQQNATASGISIWRLRAERFTTKAIESSNRLESLERALIYAQLADIWWPLDRDKAGVYYEKAVDRIFFLSSDEIKTRNTAFIDISGKILVLISNRSAKQSKRLVSLIADASDRSSADEKSNADALVAFAISLVNDNPQMAAEMGILALNLGQPSGTYELYWKLCKKDRQSAAKLFGALLRSAATNPNFGVANTVKVAAFPELSIPNAPNDIQSTAAQKTRALEFLLNYLVSQRNKYDREQVPSCANDAALVAPLLPQFAAHLPSQQGIVSSNIDHCTGEASSSSSAGSDGLPSDPSEITVEALLRLAEREEKDSSKRSYYLLRAAALANDEEKFEQAIKILDGMTDDEIRLDQDYWDSLRYTVASGFAYKNVMDMDFGRASSVLEKVPTAIRSFARIGLGLKCSSPEQAVREYCASQLDSGVLDLPKATKPIADRVSFGMSAVHKLAKFNHPSEALHALDLIVGLVNSESSDDKKKQFHMDVSLFTAAVDVRFLNLYDQSITLSIEKLEDTESKVNGFISLTKVSVEAASKGVRPSPAN